MGNCVRGRSWADLCGGLRQVQTAGSQIVIVQAQVLAASGQVAMVEQAADRFDRHVAAQQREGEAVPQAVRPSDGHPGLAV